MASIILELTVDATIDSLSIRFSAGANAYQHYMLEGKVVTYLGVYPMPCTAPLFFQQKEHLVDLR